MEVSCEEKGEYESYKYALWRMWLGNQQLIVLGCIDPIFYSSPSNSF